MCVCVFKRKERRERDERKRDEIETKESQKEMKPSDGREKEPRKPYGEKKPKIQRMERKGRNVIKINDQELELKHTKSTIFQLSKTFMLFSIHWYRNQ